MSESDKHIEQPPEAEAAVQNDDATEPLAPTPAAEQPPVTPKASADDTAVSSARNMSSHTPARAAKSRTTPIGWLNLVLLLTLLALIAWWLFGRGWWEFASGQPVAPNQDQQQVASRLDALQSDIDSLRQELGNTLDASAEAGITRNAVSEASRAANKLLTDQTSDLEQRILQELRQEQQQLIRDFGNQQQRQQQQSENTIEQRLQQLENTADRGLSRIRQVQEKTLLQQRLAEAADLLRHAERQLLLANNQQAAMDAYQLVNTLLEANSAGEALESLPGITRLRQTLARENAAINAVEMPATTTIVNQLTGLSAGIEQWPLTDSDNSSNEAAESTDDNPGTWQKLKNTLGNVVEVRRDDSVRLPLAEQALVRHQLSWQFQTLSLLALQQRETAFTAQLQNTRDYINRWFDTNASAVKAGLRQLAGFESLTLSPNWPALGDALLQLQTLREIQARRPAVVAAGPGQGNL